MDRVDQLEQENAALRRELAELRAGRARELQALHETLSQRERDLRSILDNMPAMIGYWDTDLRNRFGNHAYSTWFGIDPDTMRGRHIREVIGEERYRLNLPYLEKALRGEAQTFERAIPTPDGLSVRHSLAHYIPDRDGGTVRGFYALVFDVTALKESQAALRASEERYRAVVQDQTELICRLRPDGSLSFVNEVYCRFFARSEAELLASHWHPVAHPDDLAMIEARLATLAPDNPVVGIENRVYSGNGTLHWMQFINRGFFDPDGRLLEIQRVGRDITARKHAELALQEANTQLEQRIQTRTQQLRNLAIAASLAEERERQAIARDLHDDLGQLLHVLKLKLELLGKTLPVERAPALRELDELIVQASQQVRSLMSQLNPPILANLGLAAALRWLGAEMSRNYNLMVICALDDSPLFLPPTHASILFRAVRELLINVARHAGSATAHLGLFRRRDRILLVVEDFGAHAVSVDDALANSSGFGLRSIQERLLFLGCALDLEGKPDGGLKVRIHMPFDALPPQPRESTP